VQHWTPPVESGEPADTLGEDLARAEEPETEIQPFRAPALEFGVEYASELDVEPTVEPRIEPIGEIEELEVEAESEEELIEVEAVEEAEVDEELVEEEEEPEPTDSEPVLRPSWEQPTLFQEGEEPVDAYGTPLALVTAQAEVGEEEPQAEAVEAEDRDVVLKPTAAPAKKQPKGRSQAKERARLIAEVGCLFVDRGRVAVSMLQKQFDMDFEEATEVLDELQALGLIGPYLGGQRRDILLTRDEWLEKVSSL
jgi:DNA segregation ATPase FtsK/SpoIIIE-like protein